MSYLLIRTLKHQRCSRNVGENSLKGFAATRVFLEILTEVPIVRLAPKARSTIMDKHDVTHLERQIKELGGSLISLTNDRDFQEFITIIHRPIWTSVAEHLFVTGVVDSLACASENLSGAPTSTSQWKSRSDCQVTVSRAL
jgi:hypothetical protein